MHQRWKTNLADQLGRRNAPADILTLTSSEATVSIQ